MKKRHNTTVLRVVTAKGMASSPTHNVECMCSMERYSKDPDLKGIYVKRCKCGARPYIDRIAIVSTPWWIRCNCGRTGVSDTNKQTAIDNWNNDKLEW